MSLRVGGVDDAAPKPLEEIVGDSGTGADGANGGGARGAGATAAAATAAASPHPEATPSPRPKLFIDPAVAVRGGEPSSTPNRQTPRAHSHVRRPAAIPFFGSGEWAAGAFPGHPSPAAAGAAGAASTMAAKTTAAAMGAARFGMAGVELPDSPIFVGSAVTGGRDGSSGGGGGAGGFWGLSNRVFGGESPSRAKERAARNSLMREAGNSGKRRTEGGGGE